MARQVWFQVRGEFETDGGEARDGSRGRGASEEKVGSGVQVYLVAGGRTVSWTEVTRLGEDTIVEIVCRLQGGGKQGRIDQRQRSGDPREQQRGDDLDVGRNRRQSEAHRKHDMERTLQKYRTASHDIVSKANTLMEWRFRSAV